MPLISSSTYRPAAYLANGHLQTILPSTLRRVPEVQYQRERLELPDGDFVDLDWSRAGSAPAVRVGVISHGLEGDSQRPYVRGMARALNRAGFDALAWNYRGCGGETNRLLRAYHLGDTADLAAVIRHAIEAKGYSKVYLTGFSAGGNVTLKYLGEAAALVPPQVQRAAVFSVPTDLKASSVQISRWQNQVYLRRFLGSLRQKMRVKAAHLPGQLDLTELENLRDFPQFDEQYTAPLHGFASADAYYEHAASGQYLRGIRVPTLLVNALNDPFLTPSCFPRATAEASEFFYLETPAAGGHVGFAEGRPDGSYYSERRAVDFFTRVVPG
ncbi:alpha/beta fold hydrolase [Hymenobacter sp. HMF4947]|uniref:Alpha/beta fold hydrolase n=1 Tax=Hymenobacter ginkgonis TaxID=2682976 RepID=A0A7K1THK8_9BACT|nr:alpha/beta fold hydrolase [Hymenobacter ginkgonis]MVN77895.1 alpha/beta fold hydrolase [Hymenobacter ginkgonis]